MQLLQARVALDRISDFLAEDEVPDFVSSLKRTPVTTSSNLAHESIGIENSTFRWNQPKEAMKKKKKKDDDAKGKAVGHSVQASDVTAVEHTAQATEAQEITTEEAVFELRDINIMFPPRQLTVVTGE